MSPSNVIIFGETGVGKSSLINMIIGHDVAPTNCNATGCTFKSTPYTANIDESAINLWDTAGLNEGEKGKVPTKAAIVNLYLLIHDMKDGVTLLVFCVRGRIKETTAQNYAMFYSAFCQSKVRIVLVATGLEEENPMDVWWSVNKDTFYENGMQFFDQACVTATKGKKNLNGEGHAYEWEYEESRKKVRKLLHDSCRGSQPWKMETTSGWFASAVKSVFGWVNVFNVQPPKTRILYNALTVYGKIPDKEARQTEKEVEERISRRKSQ